VRVAVTISRPSSSTPSHSPRRPPTSLNGVAAQLVPVKARKRRAQTRRSASARQQPTSSSTRRPRARSIRSEVAALGPAFDRPASGSRSLRTHHQLAVAQLAARRRPSGPDHDVVRIAPSPRIRTPVQTASAPPARSGRAVGSVAVSSAMRTAARPGGEYHSRRGGLGRPSARRSRNAPSGRLARQLLRRSHTAPDVRLSEATGQPPPTAAGVVPFHRIGRAMFRNRNVRRRLPLRDGRDESAHAAVDVVLGVRAKDGDASPWRRW